MKLPGSTDPRVLRTRAALRQALLALIVERGWDAVGIRDICQRAGVGRSTFYTHFADKEEVLFSGFDELRRVLRAAARVGGDARPLGFTRALIEHADQSKRMFRALVGKRSSHIARMRMLQLVAELAREDLAPLLPQDRLEPAAHYVAGRPGYKFRPPQDHLVQPSSSDTPVVVMEPAEYGDCVDASLCRKRPWNRLLVPESLVRTRFVVEAHVLGDDAP